MEKAKEHIGITRSPNVVTLVIYISYLKLKYSTTPLDVESQPVFAPLCAVHKVRRCQNKTLRNSTSQTVTFEVTVCASTRKYNVLFSYEGTRHKNSHNLICCWVNFETNLELLLSFWELKSYTIFSTAERRIVGVFARFKDKYYYNWWRKTLNLEYNVVVNRYKLHVEFVGFSFKNIVSYFV